MLTITSIHELDSKKNIALIDTSSISFMQGLSIKGLSPEIILDDYDLILIPEWVITEVKDSAAREEYVQGLIDKGYPVYSIAEREYSGLAESEEGNLYQIVLASVHELGALKSYIHKQVETADPLDMEPFMEWIDKMYDNWPIPGELLPSGRIRKKNAGEISLTILAEVLSWYYPETETLTMYSQDSDVYAFQRTAEDILRDVFSKKSCVPISFKSNDAILFQLVRKGKMIVADVPKYRKDERKITYSKVRTDGSVELVTKQVDNAAFVDLVQDASVQIIF